MIKESSTRKAFKPVQLVQPLTKRDWNLLQQTTHTEDAQIIDTNLMKFCRISVNFFC